MELQAWTKYLEQSKEIEQNWAGTENFIFDCLYKNFGSKRRTGLSLTKFDLFLLFPNFLRP